MPVTLEIDEDTPFVEEEWIGRNIKYPAEPPTYVHDEKLRRLAIPDGEAKQHLLSGSETVKSLLAFAIPPQSGELLFWPIPAWFSNDTPTVTECAIFFQRPIPSADHIRRLEAAFGQAMLDGARSVVDRRFNNGEERLPLWAISYWQELSSLKAMQREWSRGLKWVENEEKKGVGMQNTSIAAKKAKQLKSVIEDFPFNEKMPKYSYLIGNEARTRQLSAFLGPNLLNDEHVNIMMQVLAEDLLLDDRQSASRTFLVAPLTFSNDIKKLKEKLKLSEKLWKRTVFSQYEARVKEEGIHSLCIPIHVNGNHWIAAEINFKNHTVAYGDSNQLSAMSVPRRFDRSLRSWTRRAFNKNFTCEGNSLEHGLQDDDYSCGIVMANTIEHITRRVPLWTPDKATEFRMDWFLRIVENLNGKSQQVVESPEILISPDKLAAVRDEVDDSVANGDFNFPGLAEAVIAQALRDIEQAESESAPDNPIPPSVPDIPIPDNPIPDNPISPPMTQRPRRRLDITDLLNPVEEETDSKSNAPSVYSDASSIQSHESLIAVGPPREAKAGDKRAEPDSDEPEDDGEDLLPGADHPKVKPAGKSKSAINSKKLRDRYKSKTLQIDTKGPDYERWLQKIRMVDEDVQVGTEYELLFSPVCSKCQVVKEVKEPYDVSRFKQHFKACTGKPSQSKKAKLTKSKSAAPSTSVFAAFGFKKREPSGKAKPEPPPLPPKHPCPGLTTNESSRIPVYLSRTAMRGGGARAIFKIALQKFKKTYSILKKAQRKEVETVQQHEWKWKNDQMRDRVFASACEREVQPLVAHKRPQPCHACTQVLKSRAFRNAIGKKKPTPENVKHTPYAFRDPVLGDLYAKYVGLDKIFSAPATTPCIQVAKAYLNGEMNGKDVFNGLMAVMATENARRADGRGNQNFPYPPAYEELCQIIRDISPAAYRALSNHLQMPSIRGLQMKRAREPRFPMTICDETFDLVQKQLDNLGHTGPVALSCDDSKLLDALRLYWDEKDQCHYLVGAAEGRMKVIDPEKMKDVLEQGKYHKATKVRVWCLTVPSPKVTPIIVAALPITEKLSAEDLFPLLKKIIDGLIDRGIRIVSYASDGTEVERNVSQMLLEMGEKIKFTIPNPLPHQKRNDAEIPFMRYRGQAMCIIQDSKHGLKTMRNNLFSGARLLVLGNHVAAYRRIRQMAHEPGSPIHLRDVEKLDRQDDNAATRLFSAATLKYLIDHHKDEALGEIVYLFVFGELVDAYQNRSMKHIDRIHLALRARYFLESWDAYIKVSGYAKSRYHISRESRDIMDILVNGLIALVIIHRDHVDGPCPLLPWLNSTEPCEHVFGSARQVVKDFTFLDFIYMIPKLRVKLREAALHSQASDGKSRASGYNHTYFDSGGVDFTLLATFPTDAEITEVSRLAAEEAESLIKLLGINPSQLFIFNSLQGNISNAPTSLPSIDAWYTAPDAGSPVPETDDQNIDSESEHESDFEADDTEYEDDDEEDRAYTLSRRQDGRRIRDLLNDESVHDGSLSAMDERKVENMTFAGISALAQDAMLAFEFADSVGDEDIDEVLLEESKQVESMQHQLRDWRTVNIPALVTAEPESEKPFGQGLLTIDILNLDILVELRRQHQTRQARLGVRTRLTENRNAAANSEVKKRLSRGLNDVLKLYGGNRGVGTGVERGVRWRTAAAGGRDGVVDGATVDDPSAGNSANSVAVADSTAKNLLLKRKKIFDALVFEPRLANLRTHFVEARVNAHIPLQLDDYCLVSLDNGRVHVGRVVVMYSKGGGKNGKHGAITDSSVITAVSYVGIEVYEYRALTEGQFSMYPQQTQLLHTQQFALITSIQILLRIPRRHIVVQPKRGVVLDPETFALFKMLQRHEPQFVDAAKLFNARNFTQALAKLKSTERLSGSRT